MPVLVPGVAVRSRRPTILIENDLAVGSWLFRLTVVDDAGVESAPSDLVVRVVAATVPTPIRVPAPVAVPRSIVDPEGSVGAGGAAGPARSGGSGRRRTRVPAPAPETPARRARPARRPGRKKRKPE